MALQAFAGLLAPVIHHKARLRLHGLHGIGDALLRLALAWLERDGPRTLWISVWSENFGAQRFYARHGFTFAGEYEFIVGAQRDREFMYRRQPTGA